MCEIFNEKIIQELNEKMFEEIDISDNYSDVEQYIPEFNGTILYNNSIIISLDNQIIEKIKDYEICKQHENNFKLLYKFSKNNKEISEELCNQILGISLKILVQFEKKYTEKFWREIQSRKEYLELEIENSEKLLLTISSIDSTNEFIKFIKCKKSKLEN